MSLYIQEKEEVAEAQKLLRSSAEMNMFFFPTVRVSMSDDRVCVCACVCVCVCVITLSLLKDPVMRFFSELRVRLTLVPFSGRSGLSSSSSFLQKPTSNQFKIQKISKEQGYIQVIII